MRLPMSLRWSSYIAPRPPKLKGGFINAKRPGRFPSKIAIRLKKACYKVSLCEKCQRQSSKAFIGLTVCAKMISGGQPLLPEILGQWPRWSEITNFRSIFARSNSAVTPIEKSSINTNSETVRRRMSVSLLLIFAYGFSTGTDLDDPERCSYVLFKVRL